MVSQGWCVRTLHCVRSPGVSVTESSTELGLEWAACRDNLEDSIMLVEVEHFDDLFFLLKSGLSVEADEERRLCLEARKPAFILSEGVCSLKELKKNRR